MNQVPLMQPVMPVQPVGYVAPQQPNYNAVKIDINNPTVGAPGMSTACPQYQSPYQPQYQPVTAPIYNYPQSNVYVPTQQYPQPVMPQYPQYPVQQPVAQEPVQQQPVACYPCPQMPMAYPYPQVNGQQNINYPPVQQPVNPVSYPQPQQPVQQIPQTQVPEPQVSEAGDTAPVVEQPQTVEPAIDLNGFIASLANPDFEAQKATMEQIPEIVREHPEKATELVDQKVFDALNNIIAFDSSKVADLSDAQINARQKLLEGKEVTDEERQIANSLAPREMAERNKSLALYSIAILDKLYADEVKKLTNTTVPLTELPEAVNVVNQLKDNPNPMVRASAIDALLYNQAPEYKKDLTTLFTVAANDQDAAVSSAAKEALEKLA